MTIWLEINGINRTSSIIKNSLTKSDVLNEKVDTLSFSVEKYGSYTFAPAVNDTVEIFDTGLSVFRGIILTVNKTTDGHAVVNHEVECVDNTVFLNRILVTETYENTTINAIITHLVATYAPTFTIVNVNAPIPVSTVTFNRISVSDALQKLSRLSNYSWYVDYDNDIHFFAKNTEPAPFAITDTSNNYIYESLQVTEDISQLRNRVLIQGGEAEGDPRDEFFDGDATKTFFKLSNKFATAPAVTVGGVTKTVGVDYLDDEASFDILWSFNEKYLKFTAAPASGTNNIQVTGIPLYSILVQVEDGDSISTYGAAEFAKTDTTITSKEEARDFAIAELEAYAQKISEASFSTYTSGLRSGQTITVQSTQRGISEDFLIQKVTFQMISPTVGIYRVELATLKTITLIDFLISQLRANGTILKDTENLLLQKYLTFTADSVTFSDSVTAQALNYAVAFRLGPQAVSGTLRPFILDGSPIS